MNNYVVIKLQHFFVVDTKIKKEMYDICPPSNDGYTDEHSLIKYTNNLNESLNYIFSELKCIGADIFGIDSNVFKRIDYLENEIKINFYKCGLDIDKLRFFYKNSISNMETEFVNAVKKYCVGYTNFDIDYSIYDIDKPIDIDDPINMAFSINEVLHYIHSYVLNNTLILQSVPLLAEKNNEYGYPITLRGIKSDLFERLFEKFPLSLDVGWTDMVAINDRKLLMMIRDRGHALSIEITLKNDIVRIEYFIPKLCNISMINSLPGINKVNENSIGATGAVETQIDLLPDTLFNFISKVPMDQDMLFVQKFFK